MTAQQAAELTERMEALSKVLAVLAQLRVDYGDDAVEWVIEQLNQ